MCSQHLDETMKKFIIKMAVFVASAAVSLSWQTYQNIFYGTKTTLTQLKFPFIDEGSNAEFVANLLLQTGIVIHGFLGYIGLEIGTSIESDFISVARKLLEYKLSKLETQYEDGVFVDSQIPFQLRKILHVIRCYDK